MALHVQTIPEKTFYHNYDTSHKDSPSFLNETIGFHSNLVNMWTVRPTNKKTGNATKKMSRQHKMSQSSGKPAWNQDQDEVMTMFQVLVKVNIKNCLHQEWTTLEYYCFSKDSWCWGRGFDSCQELVIFPLAVFLLFWRLPWPGGQPGIFLLLFIFSADLAAKFPLFRLLPPISACTTFSNFRLAHEASF